MTTAVVITLLASFLWAIVNHIDKYMLCKIDSSTSNLQNLLLFSTLVAGLVLSPIWLFKCKFHVQIDFVPLMFVFGAAILNILATYFYLKALEKNDASIVVIMFQIIPVFSFIFSLIFFKEMLSIKEIIGSLIIIISAIICAFDFEKESNEKKSLALLPMVMSSLFFSLYYICFDFAMREAEYNAVAFWFQIGLLLIGVCFICIKKYRTPFVQMLKSNGKKFISLNITNEVLNLVADLMFNFANLTLPLALVNTLNGFQGAFCFIIGAIGVLLFPKIISEALDKKTVIQKIFCIILGIIGLIVMFY